MQNESSELPKGSYVIFDNVRVLESVNIPLPLPLSKK